MEFWHCQPSYFLLIMAKILYKSPSFILGKCRCGCGEDIPIRTSQGRLQKYAFAHTFRIFRPIVPKGSKNPMWKGGRYIDSRGYWVVRKAEHPNANKLGYVREHRLIMEEHIGRYLTKDEDIHHINGNKTDNRIENLQLLSHSEHGRISINNRWVQQK